MPLNRILLQKSLDAFDSERAVVAAADSRERRDSGGGWARDRSNRAVEA